MGIQFHTMLVTFCVAGRLFVSLEWFVFKELDFYLSMLDQIRVDKDLEWKLLEYVVA
jgi:hypothetical protein